jgi:hypothetical protein
MKITEILTEAPITDYVPIGDFSKDLQFRGPDVKLAVHPTNIQKARDFFSNSPYNFRFFVVNSPRVRQHRETGEASPEKIREIFPKQADAILKNHENAITVIYIGNYGQDKVMFTPWTMAHRVGHAIVASGRYDARKFNNSAWYKLEQDFLESMGLILQNFYGLQLERRAYGSYSVWGKNRQHFNALFNKIGTQRSSRENQITRPYEFLYELFAQFIQTGDVKFNPLPITASYGRKAWGRPTNYIGLKQQYRTPEFDREANLNKVREQLIRNFNAVLQDAMGKIYLM